MRYQVVLPCGKSLAISVLLFLSTFTTGALAATAPSGSKTISRIEESSEWETCGNCGNTAGSGKTATYSMQRGITSPNLDGSSTRYKIGGSYAFKNAYWYIKRYTSPTTPLQYLKYDFYLYIPSGYGNAPQAIEFECQQKVGGRMYNFAWQADYAHHSWRIYSPSSNAWLSSGVGFSGFSTGKWHHITAEFHTGNHYTYHDAITVDGVRHAINQKHYSVAASSGHYLTNAFQLDLNGSATDYHVYVDKMSMTYK